MPKLSIKFATLTSAILFMGCATTEYQTATAPISASTSSQIKDGVDTKTDVIAMFGAPNGLAAQSVTGVGYYAGAANYYNQGVNGSGDFGELLPYRDCTVKSAAELDAGKTAVATAASMVTFGLSSLALGSGTKSNMIEDCKLLAVLLDKEDVVKAHGYVDSSIFSADRIGYIVENKSTKADVIRHMTVPSTITVSGNDEIYTYKNCLTSGKSGATVIKQSTSQKSVCQQASFIIDTNSDVVKRVTHIPFPIEKK